MSERVKLITERDPAKLSASARALGQVTAPIVIAIEDSEGRRVDMRKGYRGYEQGRWQPRSYSMDLPNGGAQRLIALYNRIFARGELIPYDCSSFMLIE